MPTMSLAALAMPVLACVVPGFGTAGNGPPAGARHLSGAFKPSDQRLDCSFREDFADYVLIGADIRTGGLFGRGRRAERSGSEQFIEALLLQLLGLELDSFDLVAESFLPAGLDQRRRAFELTTGIADRNNGQFAPGAHVVVEPLHLVRRQLPAFGGQPKKKQQQIDIDATVIL